MSAQPNRMEHLTDEQFTACLLGEAPEPEARRHVQGCSVCREEMERFGESVGIFNQASLRWSETRSERMPPLYAGARQDRRRPYAGSGLRWALAAALLAVGVGIPAALHVEREHSAAVANTGDSTEQIAADNELMASVTVELDRSAVQMRAALAARGTHSAPGKGGQR